MGFINERWLQHDYDPTHAATATEKWFVDKDTDVLTWRITILKMYGGY